MIWVLIAVAPALLPALCLGEDVDETASVNATATKPEDIDTSSPIFDNFEDNGVTNRWDGATGPWQSEFATCAVSNSTSSPNAGIFSLKTDYNVDAGGSYSGYYSHMSSGVVPAKDISGYKHLSFYVRGAAGSEFFKIEMKNNSGDSNTNSAFVYVNDFLSSGTTVTTGWKQVLIPLHNFANISDWTNASQFVVTFENDASSTNGSETHGTIYLDDISFTTTLPTTVYVDKFSDGVNRCMLGGIMGPTEYASSSYSSTSGTFQSAPYSLLLQYNLPLYQWGGAYFIFGGGSPGNAPIPHNFNGFTKLRFWAKAMGPTQNPVKVTIEIIDDGGKRTHLLTNMSTTAQDFDIDLSNFSGLQKSSIKQLNFVFSYGDVLYKSGGIYIDDIRFTTS